LGNYFGQSSFAGYALTGRDNTVVVDKEVELAVVAALGCGFQTGAGAVLNVLRPDQGSRLVIHGAGSVGFAALLAARTLAVKTSSPLIRWRPAGLRRRLLARSPSTRPPNTPMLRSVPRRRAAPRTPPTPRVSRR
jgi:D-arabinose 1-dehydrogenase-like Zn-dependent alcohol dehydrogenase